MKGGSSKSEHTDAEKSFQETIDAKQVRMLVSRAEESGKWIGFTSFGVIGWMIVVPLMAGIALGIWLDSTFPSSHSWTLMLLSAGLIFGCISSWKWVEEERQKNENDYQLRKEAVDGQLTESSSVTETEKSNLEEESRL
jgi:ATP synthase protein I